MIGTPTKLTLVAGLVLSAVVVAQVMEGQGGAKLDASLQVGSNGYNTQVNSAYGFQARRYQPRNQEMAYRSAQSAYIRQEQYYYSPQRNADPTIAQRNAIVGRPTGPMIEQSGTALDNNLQLGGSGYYNPRNLDHQIEAQRYQPRNQQMQAQAAQANMITYQTRAQNYSPRRPQPMPEAAAPGQFSNRAPSNRVR